MFIICISALSSAAMSAATPIATKNLALSTRQNPAYEPQGVRLGDLNFFPSLSTGMIYNDNIYAEDANRIHDFIYTARPALSVNSDFIRHSLTAQIYLEEGRYQDITGENYTDYGASIAGRLDVTGQTSIPLSLSYTKEHYRRGSPEDIVSSEPITFGVLRMATGLAHNGSRLAARILASIENYAYDDIQSAGGSIELSDQDYTDYGVFTSVGFSEDGYVAPFVYSNLRQLKYDSGQDRSGFSRDAFEYEGGVGSIFNISPVTQAKLNVGYINRDIEDENLSDIDGISYGADVRWEPTPLIALKLNGNRSINTTIRADASGSIDTTMNLAAEYELFPNLILQPNIGYRLSEYEGRGDSEVTSLSGGLRADYKLNRNMWFSTSYRYITQDDKSELPDANDYDSNQINLSLKLQF